ncbi:hypothetical protein BDC45DRAFT_419889, partial [Circinella umbellata]
FYSYKFKKSGLRTQVVCDVNEFAIYISEKNKLNENDCLAFDGGYYYYFEKFIENCD